MFHSSEKTAVSTVTKPFRSNFQTVFTRGTLGSRDGRSSHQLPCGIRSLIAPAITMAPGGVVLIEVVQENWGQNFSQRRIMGDIALGLTARA